MCMNCMLYLACLFIFHAVPLLWGVWLVGDGLCYGWLDMVCVVWLVRDGVVCLVEHALCCVAGWGDGLCCMAVCGLC
jgi:hypothetical protein